MRFPAEDLTGLTESRRIRGTALDVRPLDGAGRLEERGARHGLYRVHDNEWWHFEYHPDAGMPPTTQEIRTALQSH